MVPEDIIRVSMGPTVEFDVEVVADPTAVVCSPKTPISVRTMAFVWQVFPAPNGGKSQLKLGKELGGSRQFFSRQVIGFRRTFGLRGDPRKMRLKGGRKVRGAGATRGKCASMEPSGSQTFVDS